MSTPVHRGLALDVTDLGRVPYADALALQRRLQQEVIAQRGTGGSTGHLLLLEHDPPVITVSRRRGAREHLLATPEQLRRAGVEVAETDRGGDVTYHGPGQLVVYPILDLNVLGLRLHGYMRMLEGIVIDVLAHFGIDGRRDPEATGVWVGGKTQKRRNAETQKRAADRELKTQDSRPETPSKICALGVRVSRWVTMHGLALNVTTDLSHFDLIVPCGLAGRGVTSMARELGDAGPTMQEVKGVMVERWGRETQKRRNAET